MLAIVLLGSLVAGACGFHHHQALPPSAQEVRRWTLPRGVVGAMTSIDTTNQGLVVGTSKGYAVHLGIEQDGRVLVAELSDGQPLLSVHARHGFVGATFYDAKVDRHVARTTEADPAGIVQYFDAHHRTHILGAGFCRLRTDLCHVSVSIDGGYVAVSARRGIVLHAGNLCDFFQSETHPSCVRVLDDGMVAVGTFDRRVAIVDLALDRVNSVLAVDDVPTSVDAVKVGASEYQLAWTTAKGCVTTASTKRRVSQKRGNSFSDMCQEKVYHGPLVGVGISPHGAMTVVHTDKGETLWRSMRVPGKMVPGRMGGNAMWYTNDRHVIALIRVSDDNDNNDNATGNSDKPCDSE